MDTSKLGKWYLQVGMEASGKKRQKNKYISP